jgi:hypothetical protein
VFSYTICASAAGTKSLQLDRDCVFIGGHCGTKGLVSLDPSLTATGIESFTSRIDSILLYRAASTPVSGIPMNQIKFPLKAGETIFVNLAAAGAFQLFFDEPV